MIEIKNRYTNEIIKTVNADSLYKADLSKAYLSKAYLSKANLSNANLSNANLSNANLSNANLSKADLSNADLFNADLSNIIVNWNSHQLISELLIRNANTTEEKMCASFVRVYTDMCWDDFLEIDKPEREWGLYVLAKYIRDDDNHPDILDKYVIF